MKMPNVGDVVTVFDRDRIVRAKVVKSYKRRFIVGIEYKMVSHLSGSAEWTAWTTHESFERHDEGQKWIRGWDTVDAIAFRAERALAMCR
jgi:hypothetical protein